jgi:hypothetical protein
VDTPYPKRKGRLIGLCGVAGSGKSAAALILGGSGWRRVKFAGPLKSMLAAFYDAVGLDAEEIEARLEGELKEVPCKYLGGQTPRRAMQTLGTEWGRETMTQELWINAWKRRVRSFMDAGFDVVVDDLRFANEAQAIRDLDGISVLISRPSPTRHASSHASEEYAFVCDEHILNDGTLNDLSESLWAILE